MKWLVGIDEAGRGPLAGPVAVGLVKVGADFDWGQIPGVGDSKKISPKKRQVIFERAKQLQKEDKLDFVVLMGSAKEIDKRGIAMVIRELIAEGLVVLRVNPKWSFVKLDGALRAPSQYPQETIIKGDSKELAIGLASICAKETRDIHMKKLACRKVYRDYGFDVHMGYGTKVHRQAIITYGLTSEHRKTYCQNHNKW